MILSFDNRDTFDLPTEQREFNRKLRVIEREGYRLTGRTRSTAGNVAAGGAQYSQHLLGLAADVRTRNLTRVQVEALIARARAIGLVPVDETKVTKGTGPHVHLQAFPAGTIPRSVYAGRQLGVQIQETP